MEVKMTEPTANSMLLLFFLIFSGKKLWKNLAAIHFDFTFVHKLSGLINFPLFI